MAWPLHLKRRGAPFSQEAPSQGKDLFTTSCFFTTASALADLPMPTSPPLLICLHRPQPLDKLTSILSAFLVEGELEGREFGPVFSTAVSFISRADPRSVLNECSLSIEHMNCSGPQPNSMSKKGSGGNNPDRMGNLAEITQQEFEPKSYQGS